MTFAWNMFAGKELKPKVSYWYILDKNTLVIFKKDGIKLNTKTDTNSSGIMAHLLFTTFLMFNNRHKTDTLTHLIMWLAYAREQHVLYGHKEQWTYVGKWLAKSGISKVHSTHLCLPNSALRKEIEKKSISTPHLSPHVHTQSLYKSNNFRIISLYLYFKSYSCLFSAFYWRTAVTGNQGQRWMQLGCWCCFINFLFFLHCTLLRSVSGSNKIHETSLRDKDWEKKR